MTAAKDSEGKTQTGWNSVQTATSLPQDAAANNVVSVSQSHANDETEDQLAKGITIYRSYSNMAKAEVEEQPYRLSSAGVRCDFLLQVSETK